MARIYMEYCPHSDLANLLGNHARYDKANGHPMLDEDGAELPGVPIPRAALWSFFEDLAEAACSMAYGCNPLDGNSVHEHWQPIIHRDLKPENVFLALPVKDIPVLKLGDFGIAVPEKYEALSNPMGMLGAGTKGWRAPEQALSSGGIEPIFPLSSATNVWSIGRIMLALVELLPQEPSGGRLQPTAERSG